MDKGDRIVLIFTPGDDEKTTGKARSAANVAFEHVRRTGAGDGIRMELTSECGPFNEFPEADLRALFNVAGIPILHLHELPNGYWPRTLEYRVMRESSPWWLVETPHGIIKIGYRKRVMHIEWPRTKARIVVTTDDVTKDQTCVHAYTKQKAVEYLTTLADELRKTERIDLTQPGAVDTMLACQSSSTPT